MITDIASRIANCVMHDDLGWVIINYILLTAVWISGLLINRKKKSRPISIALCVFGLFALTVAGSFVWLLFFGKNGGLGGLGFAIVCFFSCIPFMCYLVLMYKTVLALLNCTEKPLASTKLAIGSSLLIVILLVIAAMSSGF